MGRIKDIITIPFRSCRKWTTAAARKDHATAVSPLVVFSDDGEDDVGAAPHVVLKMHLHCASCAAKIERVVMDIPGVEKVATDVEASRVTVTGTADAAAVATSVQVRTRKPVTVVRVGRSAAREQSVATADEWTAEVRIAGLQCGRCMGRIVQRVSRFQGVREIKLTLPDRATTRCRRSSCLCDSPMSVN